MTDSSPIITTHIKVALDGTTIDLEELISVAEHARDTVEGTKKIMRVSFSPAYPGELGSRDTVTLEFEEG